MADTSRPPITHANGARIGINRPRMPRTRAAVALLGSWCALVSESTPVLCVASGDPTSADLVANHNDDRGGPPAGAWIPQVGEAERSGWPGEYTEAGVEATKGFFGAAVG